ncbi:hypothetical protein TSAR_005997 [Trichomalopsis sarcophagae]|uniref:Uncharacterized protein n=1 Tax=Trichomalopsis sarcophagae TaxID=543379 RepID=A0A232F8Q0_9HYME|nr:hypothetical protein TSAR_005997 [Trichomalopsis sarcophagae]
MKQLLSLLMCFFLVSPSRSAEDATPTLTPTTETPATSTTLNEEEHKAKELPIDLLSPDKVLLDPNVVLARVVRDTYSNYGGGWGQRQSFSKPYERRPFGIDGYYNRLINSYRRLEPPRRKAEEVRRRYEAAPKRFKVYPVFPG